MHWLGRPWHIAKGSQGKKATKAAAIVTNPDLNVAQYPGLTTANLEAVKARTKALSTSHKSHEDVTPCIANIIAERDATKKTIGSDHDGTNFGTCNKEIIIVAKIINSTKVVKINLGNWAHFDLKLDQLKSVNKTNLELKKSKKVDIIVKMKGKENLPRWSEKHAVVVTKFAATKPQSRGAALTRKPIGEKVYNTQILNKSSGHTVFRQNRNQLKNIVNIKTSK